MKYKVTFHTPEVGQKFAKGGTNPFEDEIIYTILEIRKDNMNNNWYKLDSEHETITLPESDLFHNFVMVIEE